MLNVVCNQFNKVGSYDGLLHGLGEPEREVEAGERVGPLALRVVSLLRQRDLGGLRVARVLAGEVARRHGSRTVAVDTTIISSARLVIVIVVDVIDVVVGLSGSRRQLR